MLKDEVEEVLKYPRIDETCWWDLLPVEIAEYILKLACEALEEEAKKVDVQAVVCRSVCRQWRDIFPPPSPWIFCRFPATLALLGDLHLLKWARSEGCHWDATTCSSAAEGGHLEILQWVREQRCQWDKKTCYKAAFKGHLEVLKWARSEGCHWDAETTSWAACGGHLEVLKWAVANGCTWNPHFCTLAAKSNPSILCWIQSTVDRAARGLGTF